METKRQFTQWSRSYYSQQKIKKDWVEQIIFGIYEDDGSTNEEMTVRWYPIEGGRPVAALEVFEDSWETLVFFSDLIEQMVKLSNQSPQPEDFVQILLKCGFEDRTQATQ